MTRPTVIIVGPPHALLSNSPLLLAACLLRASLRSALAARTAAAEWHVRPIFALWRNPGQQIHAAACCGAGRPRAWKRTTSLGSRMGFAIMNRSLRSR